MSSKMLPVILIIILLLCPGCWDYRELERSSVPSAVGVDLEEDNQIAFTTQLVRPLPPGEAGSSSVQPALITARSYTVAMAARRSLLSLSQMPEWAHVRTIILGENLARNDLYLAIDFMTRNRNLRPDVNLLVTSSASSEAILSARLPQADDLGSGLQDLVRVNQSQLGIYTPTSMEEFTYRLSTPGVEPAVPQVMLIQEDTQSSNQSNDGDKNAEQTNNRTRIALSGTAVFKGNKMVGSLNETESRGYRWLSAKNKLGGYFIIASPLDSNESIGLEVREFESSTRARVIAGQPNIHLEINAFLNFYEESGTSDVLHAEHLGQIEALAAQEIKKQISACVTRSQDLNSDIMGWGRLIYEYQPDEWEGIQSKWNNIFPTIQPDIQVQVSIRGSGLTGKTFPFE